LPLKDDFGREVGWDFQWVSQILMAYHLVFHQTYLGYPAFLDPLISIYIYSMYIYIWMYTINKYMCIYIYIHI
jgi:hypothetical protein